MGSKALFVFCHELNDLVVELFMDMYEVYFSVRSRLSSEKELLGRGELRGAETVQLLDFFPFYFNIGRKSFFLGVQLSEDILLLFNCSNLVNSR